MKTVDCGFCEGLRPVVGDWCSGCSSDVADCKVKEYRPKVKALLCPVCSSRATREIDAIRGRFVCRLCDATFERSDTSIASIYPDFNCEVVLFAEARNDG